MDKIYLIDMNGRLFSVEPPNHVLSELRLNKRLNRRSSCEWCFWAISSDMEVHLYVYARKSPIAVCVTTYENQVKYSLFQFDY